ncbi:MAG TPA: phytoene desaturase family protein [Chitinophagaceae bacterium]|nr:phytoene desaturase family protein [Chitinophagaceae bacterium]
MTANKSVIIIGSGFAGLSAASFMAKGGWQVTVLEKNSAPGGRAAQLKAQGYTFDMGPSFYWMPDVFERFFAQFNKRTADYYQLHRLDPSYRIYWPDAYTNMPADLNALKKVFESIEPGSAAKLDRYLAGAAYKYRVGMQKLVYKPGLSFTEFIDWQAIKGIFHLDVFTSIKKHISNYFNHPRLRQVMEFPVLFLGALPEETPALYSLMNYADIQGGTWHPQGGMYAVVKAMHQLALEQGVRFRFDEEAKEIKIENGKATGVITGKQTYTADAVISAADYHFTENQLLPSLYRSYSDDYWRKRVMAPSCLLYYVGLNKKLSGITHHSLFFDVPFDQHGREIYKKPQWPSNPLFYVSVPSVTDASVAPAGGESLVFLVPVASGLEGDTEELKGKYFELIVSRFEKRIGQPVRDAITFKKSYSVKDFVNDYHAFRGNAYGLANTLRQTAIFRPSCRSKKVKNLFYTGQLTVPGPGVPPSLISGEVVAKEVIKTV